MKILKQVEDSKIVLYSFETGEEASEKSFIWLRINQSIVFSGTKSELQGKDDEFWKSLVEHQITDWCQGYKSYDMDIILPCATPSESGRSALDSNEFYIITEEKI